MTKKATTLSAHDDPNAAADDARAAAFDVATDAKNLAVDAGNEVANRMVVGLKEASAKAVSMTADTQKSLGDNIEKFSQRLQGLSSFNQQNWKRSPSLPRSPPRRSGALAARSRLTPGSPTRTVWPPHRTSPTRKQ